MARTRLHETPNFRSDICLFHGTPCCTMTMRCSFMFYQIAPLASIFIADIGARYAATPSLSQLPANARSHNSSSYHFRMGDA